MAQFVTSRSNEAWTFGDPFETLPWAGLLVVGNISHGLLVAREGQLLRDSALLTASSQPLRGRDAVLVGTEASLLRGREGVLLTANDQPLTARQAQVLRSKELLRGNEGALLRGKEGQVLR